MIITDFYYDIPVSWGDGDIELDGIFVSESINISSLRLSENGLIDASSNDVFFICGKGQKHIAQIEPTWQKLQCNLLDKLEFYNAQWRVVMSSIEEQQYNAIDAYISKCIKKNGFDYDNLGELAAYMQSNIDNYRIEALAIWQWVEKCHVVQSDIRIGAVKYDSVEEALAALPSFEIAEY